MKFLRFQRTFYKKSFGPGLGLMPQHSTHTKSTALPCFLFFIICWNCRSKPCFKELLKKSLKNLQNFRADYTILFCIKLLKFQETFLEKFLVSGFGAEAPTFNVHKKSTALPCFFIFFGFINTYRPCLRLRQQLRLLRQPWGLSCLQQRLPL